MSQQELLRRVVAALERAGIEYMMTGSIASSLQGEPRSTHDLDVVIQIQGAALPALLAAFPRPRFYVDEDAARETVRTDGLFNVIEAGEGDKVDFWMLTSEPFDRSRFARRVDEEVFGMRIKVSSPEDTILAKLRWAEMGGGGGRAYTDALRVFEVQGRTLDLEYITHWVEQLGVEELWRRLLSEAEVI